MLRRLLCLCLAFAAALCASAVARDAPPEPLDAPLLADFDGDGTKEMVRAHETACYGQDGQFPPPCPTVGLRSLFVELTDDCEGGAHAFALSREQDFMTLARILDADHDGHARELAFEARSGATGRGVQAKVVAFRATAGGCAAVRRTLFSYPQPATIGRRPRGAAFASGALAVGDFSPRLRGLELRTTDTYARPADPGCCPSYRRVTHWRYDVGRHAYRAYRTKLTRLPRAA